MGKGPSDIEQSIARVEATRAARLALKPERLGLAEQQALLQAFHPDYTESGKRALAVGPSAGAAMPHEMADLLEAYPLLEPGASTYCYRGKVIPLGTSSEWFKPGRDFRAAVPPLQAFSLTDGRGIAPTPTRSSPAACR